jgi:hypothetical protein
MKYLPMMTTHELEIAMDALGLTRASLARTLNITWRQAHNWATGVYPIPTPVALLLGAMLDHGLTVRDLRS